LWLGRLAEALRCTPRQAYEEWCYWPSGFLEELIESCAFRDVYLAVQGADDGKTRQAITGGSALGALAGVIEFEMVKERRGR
jgi:hypothetical protein